MKPHYLKKTIKSSLLKIWKTSIKRNLFLNLKLIDFVLQQHLIVLHLLHHLMLSIKNILQIIQNTKTFWKKKRFRFNRLEWLNKNSMKCLPNLQCYLYSLNKFRLWKTRWRNRWIICLWLLKNNSVLFFKNLKICKLKFADMIVMLKMNVLKLG